MQTTLGVEVLGVVQPAAVQAVAATRRGKVGVLGTPATVATGAYAAAIAAIDPFVEVVSVPVRRPRDADRGGDDRRAARRGGARLLRAAARGGRRHGDPRLHALSARAPIIQRMLGPEATIVTSGAPLARQVEHVLGHARARQPRRGRGQLRVPVHRRAGGVPCAGHALPPAAARRGRAGAAGQRRRRGGGGMTRHARAQRRPRSERPAAGDDRAGLRGDRDRVRADLLRRDARDLHRVDPGVGAALDGRHAAAAG